MRPQAGRSLELYDLKTDLGEKHNVAEQHPEIIAGLEERLKTARTESELWPVKQAGQDQSKTGETKE